jgi:YVTN family beta-propeller protein
MNRSLIVGICLASSLFAQAPAKWTVEPRFKPTGDQGWDLLAVDTATNRLFVAHGDKVDVVDLAGGRIAGSVPGFKGAHGVAVTGGKGFATSGKDSSVVVFDAATLVVDARVPTGGAKPDAIAADPATGRVFVGLAGSDALAVIDPATRKVVSTISLPGNPELMAPDGKGRLFVNVENRSEVAVVDTRSLQVAALWKLAPGEEPTGLSFDPVRGRVFSACANRMVVVLDARDGKVLAHLPVGERVDGAAFDPGTGTAWIPGGDNSLTAVKEDSTGHFAVVQKLSTRSGARTVALDPRTHRLYLPSAEFGPRPAPTADQPKPRPPVVPGSFAILEVAPAD